MQAIAELALDVWFCGEFTALLRKGPSASAQILQVVKQTVGLLPTELPASAKAHMQETLDLLKTMCMCLAQLCRAIPGTLGSSIDDFLRVLDSSTADANHVWLTTFRGILESPSSPWQPIMSEVLRTAASSKLLMPAYNDACKVATAGDSAFEQVAEQMAALPKLKEGFRPGALRKLEQSLYNHLHSFARKLLDTPGEQDLTFGTAKVRQLITLLDLLSTQEGCQEVIEDLRKFAVGRQTALAMTDLKHMAQECMKADGSVPVNWQDLQQILKALKPNVDISHETLEIFQAFAQHIFAALREEAWTEGVV